MKALFGWRIQPESASHNSIFLSREISQPSSQQYFPLTRNQPASQPASRKGDDESLNLNHRLHYHTQMNRLALHLRTY